MFNNKWLCKCPCPHRIIFGNVYEFKRDLNPLLKVFNIEPVLTSVKNPQANAQVYQLHQVILNMLVNNDLDKKVFDYIDPWCEPLASIA